MAEWTNICDSQDGKGLLIVIDSNRDEEFLNLSAGGYFSAWQCWGGVGHYLDVYLHQPNKERITVASFHPNSYAGVRVIF